MMTKKSDKELDTFMLTKVARDSIITASTINILSYEDGLVEEFEVVLTRDLYSFISLEFNSTIYHVAEVIHRDNQTVWVYSKSRKFVTNSKKSRILYMTGRFIRDNFSFDEDENKMHNFIISKLPEYGKKALLTNS